MKKIFLIALLLSFLVCVGIAAAANSVSLSSPADNYKAVQSSSVSFTYTPIFDSAISSCSLYTNDDGTWGVKGTNSTPVVNNSISNTISRTVSTVGSYSWNVLCTDGTNSMFATANRTISFLVPKDIEMSATTLSFDGWYGNSRSSSINVVKTGANDVSGIYISYNVNDFKDSQGKVINITFTPNESITADDTATSISVSASADLEIKQGTYDGTVTVTDGDVSTTFILNITMPSILDIDNVDVNDDQFQLGDTIEVDIDLKNDHDDIDLDSCEATLTFRDGSSKLEDDDDDDIEIDTDRDELDEIDGGDEENINFESVDVPHNVDDGDEYDVYIEVECENADNSAQRFTAIDDGETIEFEKRNHEIEIYKSEFSSNKIACGQRSIELNVGVRNIGAKDEDVQVTVQSTEINVDAVRTFELDKDYDNDDNDRVERFTISTNDLNQGVYSVDIKAYYDDNDKYMTGRASFEVPACGTSTTPATPDTDTKTDSTSTDTTVKSGSGDDKDISTKPADSTVKDTQDDDEGDQKNFAESDTYVILLIIGIVIVLGAILYLAVVFLAAPPKK
ncbi:hypothetical protein ACFL1H_05675 [Nanoarchaeota archaeon]